MTSLLPHHIKKCKPTEPRDSIARYDDLAKRNFNAEHHHQLWVVDLT